MDWKHSINSCVKKVICCGYTKKTELGTFLKYGDQMDLCNSYLHIASEDL